jgi:NADPH2:quinone reductase
LVLFGASSGSAPEIQPEILNKKGCLFLTRPSVFPHNATPALLQENAKAVFDAIAKGFIKVKIAATFPLEQAADAHRAAESRKVSGAIVMIP